MQTQCACCPSASLHHPLQTISVLHDKCLKEHTTTNYIKDGVKYQYQEGLLVAVRLFSRFEAKTNKATNAQMQFPIILAPLLSVAVAHKILVDCDIIFSENDVFQNAMKALLQNAGVRVKENMSVSQARNIYKFSMRQFLKQVDWRCLLTTPKAVSDIKNFVDKNVACAAGTQKCLFAGIHDSLAQLEDEVSKITEEVNTTEQNHFGEFYGVSLA